MQLGLHLLNLSFPLYLSIICQPFFSQRNSLKKLTDIIRNFWWTSIKEESTAKSLWLSAWAYICIENKIGGLGVPNLQAMNQ
jgi:hypothetical protein